VAAHLLVKFRRGLSRDLLFLVPVVGFVLLFALVPAAVLFSSSVAQTGGLGGIRAVVDDPLNVRAIDNSFLQGGLSAGFAVAFGYPAGVFVGRYSWRGRSLVRSLLLVPFLLPSLVVVLGVLDLFGPSGVVSSLVPALGVFGRGTPAIVGANLLFNVPIVVLFTAAGCDAASPALEETVQSLGGSPMRAYRDAWGTPTWVGAAVGGLLTFLFSALSFAPPLLLCGTRCYTVEARIYSLDQVLLAPGAAGVLALVMVGLFLVPTVAYLALLARLRAQPGRRASRPRPVPWRTPVGSGLAVATGGVLVAELALIGAVLYRTVAPVGGAGAGAAWRALFSPATSSRLGIGIPGAVANTLVFAVAASTITLLLGIASGHAVARRPGRTRLVGLVLFVPLLVSPVVLAFALSNFWRPLLGGGSTVWFLVIASQTVLALPFALQSIEIPLAGLDRSASEAARTLGASGWVAYLDTDLPRVRQGLATAGLFAFALGLGEFTATNFLVTAEGRFVTLPVGLYGLANSRQYAAADAGAGLLLLLSLAVFLALSLGGRRVEL
jgi:thiamine transport system permease protein